MVTVVTWVCVILCLVVYVVLTALSAERSARGVLKERYGELSDRYEKLLLKSEEVLKDSVEVSEENLSLALVIGSLQEQIESSHAETSLASVSEVVVNAVNQIEPMAVRVFEASSRVRRMMDDADSVLVPDEFRDLVGMVLDETTRVVEEFLGAARVIGRIADQSGSSVVSVPVEKVVAGDEVIEASDSIDITI